MSTVRPRPGLAKVPPYTWNPLWCSRTQKEQGSKLGTVCPEGRDDETSGYLPDAFLSTHISKFQGVRRSSGEWALKGN